MIIVAQDGILHDITPDIKIQKTRLGVGLFGPDGSPLAGLGSYESERAAEFVARRAAISKIRGKDYKMPSAEEAEVEWRAAREEERAQAKERLRRTREIVWVPVEERFPDNDGWVLVTADNGEHLSVFEAWCDEDQCWRENDGKAFPDPVEVIAWAETPEPYKRKDEREEEN